VHPGILTGIYLWVTIVTEKWKEEKNERTGEEQVNNVREAHGD